MAGKVPDPALLAMTMSADSVRSMDYRECSVRTDLSLAQPETGPTTTYAPTGPSSQTP
jgi:hypothetical protein